MARRTKLRRRALRVHQHPKHPLYLFTLTGDELLQVSEILHASRNHLGQLMGYQRPEARRHIRNIAQYLDGDSVLFPNPIILAFSSEVRFRAEPDQLSDGHGISGHLHIPLPRDGKPKPAWVVDGQQRMMAIAMSKRRNSLIVPVNAFIANDLAVQREQFIRVNSSKPLPRRLISELLPHVDAQLPEKLSLSRVPSAICDVLNQDPQSPFFGLIWRPSMSAAARRRAVVTDSSVLHMLEESMNTPSGCLFPYRNLATGSADIQDMLRVLLTYWTAVRDVWPNAWGLPSSESRLMHGAGLRGMGRVMDRLMPSIDADSSRAPAQARRQLHRLRPVARWTEGRWEDLDLQWNEVQNTPSHVGRLSRLLVRAYMEGV
jgi:DGQHR domain-containing protein